MVSWTPSLGHWNDNRFHGYTPSLDRFHGFMVLQTQSQGHQDDDRFRGFIVSSTPSLGHQMPIGFMVSLTPTWDIEMTIGCMVLWFCGSIVSWHISPSTQWNQVTCQHGFMVSLLNSIGGQQEADRFHGFMVPLTPSPGHQNDNRFHDPEIECTKPWNHETLKPTVILMSKGWSRWNHETMKPRNHETYSHFDDPETE